MVFLLHFDYNFEGLKQRIMKNQITSFALLLLSLFLAVVSQAQVASFTIGGTNGYCRNASISFNNTSTGATGYQWDFGDGNSTSDANPSHAYSSSGTYLVTLTATNGVQTNVTRKALYVRDYANAYFYFPYTGGSAYLPGEKLKPINSSSSSVTYLWDDGNGHSATTEKYSFAYNTPGNYTVKLMTTNGCGDTSWFTQGVQIIDTNNYTPYSSGYVSPSLACPGTTIHFTSYTDNYTALRWILGDGNSVDNMEELEHTYTIPGTYNVKLIAYYKTKSDTSFYTVKISNTEMDKGAVNAYISPQYYDFNTSKYRYINCAGFPFTLNGTYGDEIVHHKWKVDGGTTLNAKDTMITFANQGDYTLWYIFENACGVKDSMSFVLNVRTADSIPKPYLYINVTAGPDGSICPGNIVYLSNYSPDADSTRWVFHDGSVVYNENYVSKKYTSAGNYTVQLISKSGCRTDTASTVISVNNNSASYAGFNVLNAYSAGTPICYGDSVFASADSLIESMYRVVTVTQHNWNMGDGKTFTGANIGHRYTNPGYYSVVHQTVNSCGQTAVDFRTIWASGNAAPVANFYVVESVVCAKDSILIDQFSSKTDSVVIFMGDGNKIIQTRHNFFPHLWYAYQNPGQYNVMLLAFNKCSVDTAYDQVTVAPSPSNQIITPDTTIQTGTSITFIANLTGTSFHVWFYGPGQNDTSTANSLTRTFNTPGNYYIYLGTENNNGCKGWDSVKVTVVLPGALSEIQSLLPSRVYPNPASDLLTAEFYAKSEGKALIRVADITGKVIFSIAPHASIGLNKVSMDIAHLPSGIYFIQTETHEGVRTHKFIKQ